MSALSTSNEAQDVSHTNLPTGLVHNGGDSTFQQSFQATSANNSNWDPNDFYEQQYRGFVPVTTFNALCAQYQSVIDNQTLQLTEVESKWKAAKEENERIKAEKELAEAQLAEVEAGLASCTEKFATSEHEVLRRGIRLQKLEEQHAIDKGEIEALKRENKYLRNPNADSTVERDYLNIKSQLESEIPTSDQGGHGQR
ncbi:uncharacterized protein L203_104939 [Cryptococcus depauperatus CBS 7841]|uniref:Uncharacterized protein n=1 Tax=Cryptococcus depauperatus CBS 7841 TaxID=1295531 RepID=A0AAJ8JWM5_9TREE